MRCLGRHLDPAAFATSAAALGSTTHLYTAVLHKAVQLAAVGAAAQDHLPHFAVPAAVVSRIRQVLDGNAYAGKRPAPTRHVAGDFNRESIQHANTAQVHWHTCTPSRTPTQTKRAVPAQLRRHLSWSLTTVTGTVANSPLQLNLHIPLLGAAREVACRQEAEGRLSRTFACCHALQQSAHCGGVRIGAPLAKLR